MERNEESTVMLTFCVGLHVTTYAHTRRVTVCEETEGADKFHCLSI